MKFYVLISVSQETVSFRLPKSLTSWNSQSKITDNTQCVLLGWVICLASRRTWVKRLHIIQRSSWKYLRLTSEPPRRYSYPLPLFAFFAWSVLSSHTVETYQGFICDYGWFAHFRALQAVEGMVTNRKPTHYPALPVLSLSMPLWMCSLFHFPSWVPRPIISILRFTREWVF